MHVSDVSYPPQTGEPRPYTLSEQNMRRRILDCNLGAARARKVVRDLDGTVPWYSRLSFLEGLAALTKEYTDEVQRRTHVWGSHAQTRPLECRQRG